MEVVILAGGRGTRLSSVVQDVPKPMAPINGVPFLKFIIEYLKKENVKHVVLAVGYKKEIIKNYFGNHYHGIEISYSEEVEPLGTGGAIKQALTYCKNDDVIVMNGDTFFEVDLVQMMNFHKEKNSELSIAVKPMNSFDRYGSVTITDGKVLAFAEKQHKEKGLINGGTYIVKRELLQNYSKNNFSFEKDVLEIEYKDVYAFSSSGYFIDMGIPEDYYKAQKELPRII